MEGEEKSDRSVLMQAASRSAVRESHAEGEHGSRRFRSFMRREVWLLEMAVQGEPESNLQIN